MIPIIKYFRYNNITIFGEVQIFLGLFTHICNLLTTVFAYNLLISYNSIL
jgi:hypothetical protein